VSMPSSVLAMPVFLSLSLYFSLSLSLSLSLLPRDWCSRVPALWQYRSLSLSLALSLTPSLSLSRLHPLSLWQRWPPLPSCLPRNLPRTLSLNHSPTDSLTHSTDQPTDGHTARLHSLTPPEMVFTRQARGQVFAEASRPWESRLGAPLCWTLLV